MGLDNRAPTSDEQAAMEHLAEAALDVGAFGVSSGPFTAPGAYARPAELEALAGVAARRGAAYATHLRDEAANVLAAVDEVIAAAERTGARTRIVHVKISGTDGWGGAAHRQGRGRAPTRASPRLRSLSLHNRGHPLGIAHVLVNGVAVIDAGTRTGARPGHVLRRAA